MSVRAGSGSGGGGAGGGGVGGGEGRRGDMGGGLGKSGKGETEENRHPDSGVASRTELGVALMRPKCVLEPSVQNGTGDYDVLETAAIL